MIKFGNSPYLECSLKGDKRFSAFYATIGGTSIEALYQGYKVFPDGITGLSCNAAKGRTPSNLIQCRLYYTMLWYAYIIDHPELHLILMGAPGLSDMFGQAGHACQAEELWKIRQDLKQIYMVRNMDAIKQGAVCAL